MENNPARLTTGKKFAFLAIIMLGFMLSNCMRISGVVVLPPLGKALGISEATIGFLSSLFFYTYGLFYGIWGVMIDKRGTFLCCGAAFVVSAVGAFMLVFADSAFMIGIGRALCGVGYSSVFTGLLAYCARNFRKRDYAIFMGAGLMVGHSGTILAVAPLGFAVEYMGTAGVFFFLGLLTLAVGVSLLYFRRYDKTPAPGKPPELLTVFSGLWKVSQNIWRNYTLRVVMITWGVSAAAVSTLQGLWAVAWLQTSAGFSQNQAYLCATWISIGLVFGPPFGGWLAKRLKDEKNAFFISCALIETGWLMWLVFSLFSAPPVLFSAAGFMIGFWGGESYVFMGDAVLCTVSRDQNAGTIGVMNMIIYILVIVFQWGTGLCLDFFAGPRGSYTATGFFVGFLIIVLLQGWSFLMIKRMEPFGIGLARKH